MKGADGTWRPKLKLSEQTAKATIPGVLQVRRFRLGDELVGDMIYDEIQGVDARHVIVDAKDRHRRKPLPPDVVGADLLVPVMRGGQLVGPFAAGHETLEAARTRTRAQQQLQSLHPTVRRLLNPHEYPVGIDVGLHEFRDQMILSMRLGFDAQGEE
jgi:nicotinate phosphoribosyltransferase